MFSLGENVPWKLGTFFPDIYIYPYIVWQTAGPVTSGQLSVRSCDEPVELHDRRIVGQCKIWTPREVSVDLEGDHGRSVQVELLKIKEHKRFIVYII